VVNTNWDLFFDKSTSKYYLLYEKMWLTAASLGRALDHHDEVDGRHDQDARSAELRGREKGHSSNWANPENWNCRHLAAGKGISLKFLLDSESVLLFFKTAGFSRQPTPPFPNSNASVSAESATPWVTTAAFWCKVDVAGLQQSPASFPTAATFESGFEYM
jgi:hypothetical protein